MIEAATAFGGSVFNEDPVRIGAGFKGKIAKMSVYSKAFSGEEVRSLYEQGLRHE